MFASIWSWAVIFEKLMLLRRINGRATRFENRFWAGGSVDELYSDVGDRPNNPMAAIFAPPPCGNGNARSATTPAIDLCAEAWATGSTG